MRAISVIPSVAHSVALIDVSEPEAAEGACLVETLRIGVCGTDIEIVQGLYGEAPPSAERLVIGHESLGRILDAPPRSGFTRGELVVGIVRRPDPVPCVNCAALEWDMCRNGLYTEHGIKSLHGFSRERFRADPDALVKVDRSLGLLGVLVEPASVVAKAWEHIEAIGKRALFRPKKVVITGAGPVGLLAALLGVERGHEVHVFDRVTSGKKPELVSLLGAGYHCGDVDEALTGADVVVECTGASAIVLKAMDLLEPDGILCLTGVSSGGRSLDVDLGALNRSWVLENNVIFGSVNANRRHYAAAVQSLEKADRTWLSRLITRAVPLTRWPEAFARGDDDIKVVIDFATAE